MALAALLRDGEALAAESSHAGLLTNPQASRQPHFAAKAKSVIYLFMAGGPSQLELFDYKPKLQELNGKPVPESFIKHKRFSVMDLFTKEVPKLLGTRRQFARLSQCRASVSDCVPHIAGIVDDSAFFRSA